MNALPAVTTGLLRRWPPQHLALGVAFGAIAIAALILPREAPAAATPVSFARSLARDAVAVRLPHAWLAADPLVLVAGDRVDVLGAQPGERAGAVAVLADARVLEADRDALILATTTEDAAALAVARAAGYLLVVVVRPP